jgi:hypothetical protein
MTATGRILCYSQDSTAAAGPQNNSVIAACYSPLLQDTDVPLQALIPPLQHLPEAGRRAMLQEPLLPVDVEGDRQYFLSVRYGRLVDPAALHALLRGQLEGQQLRDNHET